MSYNIHPLFVHFPIALLFLYSLLKIIPLKKWFSAITWVHIERTMLVVGVLGAFAAMFTGDAAEHLVHPNKSLVEIHSNFAAIATFIYCLLLLGEGAAIFNAKEINVRESWKWLHSLLKKVEALLCHRFLSVILAFCGLIAITLTGLFGGVIAYGLTADPFAGFILKLFNINL